jgi:hypothetical protein
MMREARGARRSLNAEDGAEAPRGDQGREEGRYAYLILDGALVPIDQRARRVGKACQLAKAIDVLQLREA